MRRVLRKDFSLKKPNYMILFFGPDGSGKSTLAQALFEALRAKGLRVKLSWMRGTHTFASSIAFFLSKFRVFEGTDNPYYNISVPSSMKGFWQVLEFSSVIPIVLFKFVFPRFLGFCVIGERCFVDFIVWVAIVTRDESYLGKLSSRFFQRLALKSYARVYVTADTSALLKRRSDVSATMLRKQQSLYEKLANTVEAYIINTTGKSSESSLEKLMLLLEI